MPYLILSLDGGGIRGVLSAAMLQRLQKRAPFTKDVELFAGTSTGGILALGLAHGFKPADLVALYEKDGPKIFGDRDIFDTLSGPADELFRANYATRQLKQVLEAKFGKTKLRELKKGILIPAFDLDCEPDPDRGFPRQWRPKFFTNQGKKNDGRRSVVDVAVATSAAPTYFPSHQGFIDGGVAANNPGMCAIAEAVKNGVSVDDIWMISIGTGYNPLYIEGDSLDWGQTQWTAKLRLLRLVMEGITGVARYQCEQLLNDRYVRLQVELDQVFDLDDTDNIGALQTLGANHNIEPAVELIKRFRTAQRAAASA